MKYVKKFENFKINEEVPFNYDASIERMKIKWTEEELSDLKKLGASNIKDSSALIDEDDLVVFISKEKSGYKITPNKEIMSFNYGLKPNLGGERTPDVSDIDRTKKIPKKLLIDRSYQKWDIVLDVLHDIFTKYKFGWDSEK